MNGTHVRTPWSRKILELLADGDWHPIEDVVAEAMKTVPPGVAFRAGEANRHRTNKNGRTRGDESTSTAAGARQIVRDALNSLCRTGHGEHVERSERGYMVRLANRSDGFR